LLVVVYSIYALLSQAALSECSYESAQQRDSLAAKGHAAIDAFAARVYSNSDSGFTVPADIAAALKASAVDKVRLSSNIGVVHVCVLVMHK
jgi:dUTPase